MLCWLAEPCTKPHFTILGIHRICIHVDLQAGQDA